MWGEVETKALAHAYHVLFGEIAVYLAVKRAYRYKKGRTKPHEKVKSNTYAGCAMYSVYLSQVKGFPGLQWHLYKRVRQQVKSPFN